VGAVSGGHGLSVSPRDVPAVHEQAEAAVALSTDKGFPGWAALGTSLRGWALAIDLREAKALLEELS
jgi:hypothetical protein